MSSTTPPTETPPSGRPCSPGSESCAFCGSPERSPRRCRLRTPFSSAPARWLPSTSTLGAWEALAETYKDVDIVDVPSEGYGDAHVLYDVGVGAAHLASFADAAFVGATAVALLSGAVVRWRRLGWVGVGLTVVWLINAPLQIFGTSDWSDAVGAVIFVSLLAWVFALSVILVMSLRSDAATSVPRTPSIPG